MIDDINSSLLTMISPSQVDDLIFEERLKIKGYEFQYIVDPYDLSNYCFPLGLTKKEDKDVLRNKLSIEDKLDEHITLDVIFTNPNCFFFCLDEYLDELNDFQIVVKRSADLGIRLVDTNKELLKLFKSKENFYKSLDLLSGIEKAQLSLLLSIAIGYLRSGLTKLKKLFVGEGHFITGGDDETKRHPSLKELFNTIESTRPKYLSDKIYFTKSKVLKQKYQGEPHELQNRLNKVLNDSDVVDRVIGINKQLIQKKSKQLCLYVSSTTSSLRWFQGGPPLTNDYYMYSDDFDSEVFDIISLSHPMVKGSKFNCHRTTSQLFLSMIMDDKTPNDKIDNLERFKESLDTHYAYTNIDSETDLFLGLRIKRFRERLENYAILTQFPRFKSIIETAAENPTVISYKVLFDVFEQLLQSEENEIEQFDALRDENFRFFSYVNNFRKALNEGIKNLKGIEDKGKLAIKLSKGKDPIRGQYHIMPIVFFTRSTPIRSILDRLTTFFLNGRSQEDLIRVINQVLAETIDMIEVQETNDSKLIGCMILTVLPSGSQNKNIYRNEEIVLNRVREILEYEILDNEPELKSDFYYLGSWIGRRLKNYRIASSYSKEGKKINSEDPRFHHSLGLVAYCEYEEGIRRNVEQIDYAIECLRVSLKLYAKTDKTLQVDKSIVSVLNTLVYCLTLKWQDYLLPTSKSIDKALLIEAREYLKEVKNKDSQYSSIPEFLQTESFLEFMEYRFYRQSKMYDMAQIKLLHSKSAIRRALQINPNDSLYIDFQKKLLRF